MFIENYYTKIIFDKLKDWLKGKNDKRFLLIAGPSGCGKTFVVNEFKKKFCNNIVISESSFTNKLHDMLNRIFYNANQSWYYCYSNFSLMPLNQKEECLSLLFKEKNIKMLILDDIQDSLLTKQRKDKFLNYFEELQEKLKIPFVFLGTKQAEKKLKKRDDIEIITIFRWEMSRIFLEFLSEIEQKFFWDKIDKKFGGKFIFDETGFCEKLLEVTDGLTVELIRFYYCLCQYYRKHREIPDANNFYLLIDRIGFDSLAKEACI